jgi:hypothetical protein
MPNIVYDVKLDFKDVLLRPKRSTLRSRAEVSAERKDPNPDPYLWLTDLDPGGPKHMDPGPPTLPQTRRMGPIFVFSSLLQYSMTSHRTDPQPRHTYLLYLGILVSWPPAAQVGFLKRCLAPVVVVASGWIRNQVPFRRCRLSEMLLTKVKSKKPRKNAKKRKYSKFAWFLGSSFLGAFV